MLKLIFLFPRVLDSGPSALRAEVLVCLCARSRYHAQPHPTRGRDRKSLSALRDFNAALHLVALVVGDDAGSDRVLFLDVDPVFFRGGDGAIRGVRALGIRGCSVSMPFKEAVIPLVDELNASADAIESVNTIVNNDNAKVVRFLNANSHDIFPEFEAIAAAEAL